MVWDLGRALHKKEEFESARLMDFEYRQRARSFRLMGQALDRIDLDLGTRVALADDPVLLEQIAAECAIAPDDLFALYTRCRDEARRQLIAERGDPTPYRLG